MAAKRSKPRLRRTPEQARLQILDAADAVFRDQLRDAVVHHRRRAPDRPGRHPPAIYAPDFDALVASDGAHDASPGHAADARLGVYSTCSRTGSRITCAPISAAYAAQIAAALQLRTAPERVAALDAIGCAHGLAPLPGQPACPAH